MAPKKKVTTTAKKEEAKTTEPKVEEKKEETDAKKRKADESKEEPPKKEAKKETASKATESEEMEDGAEREKDAPLDKRPILKDTVSFNPSDTTLNVIPTVGGRVLMALSDGGMQYLIAGARANIGIKAGRYMYEVKIIEALNPAESSTTQRGRVPVPRQLVRLGFSVAGSSTIVGDTDDSVCFDSEGFYHADKKKSAVSQRFTRDQVIAVLLNLDPKSPNHNTVSLFREGERISEPQPLPDNLKDKVLYPHICFRSVTVHMNFGPQSMKPLPFKCRMLQGAAAVDTAPATSPSAKSGKCKVMLPVAFPDEGTFDWLDEFLDKNPTYVELSDRKILEWAVKSGLWRPKATGWKHSNDKPEFNFQIPSMDDLSVRRVLNAVAPVVPRNYVIMEVKSNLIKAERMEVLNRFSNTMYNKVATVIMGEPAEDYKEKQREVMIKEKQEKADAEWRAKKVEKDRKKAMELRQKQLSEMRKQAEERRKAAVEEMKRKRDEEEKKRQEAGTPEQAAKDQASEAVEVEGEAEPPHDEEKEEMTEEVKPEETAEVKDEEDAAMNTETKEEGEEKKEEEKADVKMEEAKDELEEEETEPPKVELSEEEQKKWFRTHPASDLTNAALNQFFAGFSIPDKDEGFTEILYEWKEEEESIEYLKKWVMERKLTARIEDLQPSQWFKDQYAAWQKSYQGWQAKQKEYKNSAAAQAKKDKKKEDKTEGDDKKDDDGDADMTGGPEDMDIFTIEDVNDVGNGEPLFATFLFEDWALLQLRYEFYLLMRAFMKDVNDPERLGIPETHLAFYYNKYYRKQLNPKNYGVNTNQELIHLVKDTVSILKNQILKSEVSDDVDSTDIFVKLTEENRRERQRRIDAGDETAKLKFSPLVMQQPQPAPARIMTAQTMAATAGQAATTAPRPGMWAAPRPVQTWSAGARGALYSQAGYRAPMMGRWPAQQQSYAPRPPFLAQKWR